MRCFWTIVIGLVVGLNSLAANAVVQMQYPMGYGGYGMGGWGMAPVAGYMTGMGNYARSQGVYKVEKAEAKSINTDTMIRWNTALRASQRALRETRSKEAKEEEAGREARVEERKMADGTTLNNLLLQIFDSDPALAKSARAPAPLSPNAIREVPFEWDSEALTFCIDQMTGEAAMPRLLMGPNYVDQRAALRAAVEPALKEDAQGEVSLEARHRIHRAIADFRAMFLKNSASYQPGYQDALDYLTTLASLNRMLRDPGMKKFLAMLEDGKERTVGDLIAFMNAYNLRFGAAKSDRQVEIYRRLVPLLTTIRDEVNHEPAGQAILDKSGEHLRSAAKETFKPMRWDQLEAHSREQ